MYVMRSVLTLAARSITAQETKFVARQEAQQANAVQQIILYVLESTVALRDIRRYAATTVAPRLAIAATTKIAAQVKTSVVEQINAAKNNLHVVRVLMRRPAAIMKRWHAVAASMGVFLLVNVLLMQLGAT